MVKVRGADLVLSSSFLPPFSHAMLLLPAMLLPAHAMLLPVSLPDEPVLSHGE